MMIPILPTAQPFSEQTTHQIYMLLWLVGEAITEYEEAMFEANAHLSPNSQNREQINPQTYLAALYQDSYHQLASLQGKDFADSVVAYVQLDHIQGRIDQELSMLLDLESQWHELLTATESDDKRKHFLEAIEAIKAKISILQTMLKELGWEQLAGTMPNYKMIAKINARLQENSFQQEVVTDAHLKTFLQSQCLWLQQKLIATIKEADAR